MWENFYVIYLNSGIHSFGRKLHRADLRKLSKVGSHLYLDDKTNIGNQCCRLDWKMGGKHCKANRTPTPYAVTKMTCV